MSVTVRLGRITVDMGARMPAAPPAITTAYLNAWREATDALIEELDALANATTKLMRHPHSPGLRARAYELRLAASEAAQKADKLSDYAELLARELPGREESNG